MSTTKSYICRAVVRLETLLACLALAGRVACDSGASRAVAAAAPGRPPAPTTSPQRGASGPASDGHAGCRFQRPRLWTAGKTEWLGGCRQGLAEGSGVIVNRVEGAEPERFYGQLESGAPSIGVLHTAGGFMAGRWHDGALVAALPDDMAHRNVLIEAFRVAADAATATSKLLADKGDAAASSFYARQARTLSDQID